MQASVQDPRPATRHGHSQRLPVWSDRPRPLQAPVGRGETLLAGSLEVRFTAVTRCTHELRESAEEQQ